MSSWSGLAAKAALIEVAVLTLVAAVCRAFGWTSLAEYSTALFTVGAAFLVIGTITSLGQSAVSGSFQDQYGHTATAHTSSERAAQDLADRHAGGRCRLLGYFVGISTIAISVVLGYLIT